MKCRVIKVVETSMIHTDQDIYEVYVSKVETMEYGNDVFGYFRANIESYTISDLLVYPKNEYYLKTFVGLNKSLKIFKVNLSTFNVRIESFEGVKNPKEVYFHPDVILL